GRAFPSGRACDRGVAALPVLLPMMVLAARFAILARVTTPAAMVRATVPAVDVASPVMAGIRPAGRAPEVMFEAFVVSVVADAASPDTSVEAMASRLFACAAVRS